MNSSCAPACDLRVGKRRKAGGESRMSGNQQGWPGAGQGQGPWQQQPDQGQPPYQPYPPGYGPPGQPPGRRRRHPLRVVLLGVGALVVVIIAASAIASATKHKLTTAGSSSPASSGTSSHAAAKVRTAAARIGSSIVLAGNSDGERMTVTVVKVFRHARPASDFDAPQAGMRLYAIQFRLTDTGSAAYSDAPSNGAQVVDSAGQSYEASIASSAAECQSFPGTENIAPGSSGLGCIVFEVPVKAKITAVQFTLDSGLGPQTGEWD